jgi:hypothetical protein
VVMRQRPQTAKGDLRELENEAGSVKRRTKTPLHLTTLLR